MLTVVLPFKSNSTNLAVLLSQLQPQLSPTDDIYIIDSSKTREGFKVATMYGTTRNLIFVESTEYKNFLEYGIQSMNDNNQEAMLVLNENAFISSTFIANMKKTVDSKFQIISPQVKRNPYDHMDTNFKSYNPSQIQLEEADDFSAECFLLTRQSKRNYGLLKSECVIINQAFTI